MSVQSARGRAFRRGSSGTSIPIAIGLKVGVGGELMGTTAGYADVAS